MPERRSRCIKKNRNGISVRSRRTRTLVCTVPYHQHVLLLFASAMTCSTISDHGCCSCRSSSNDSQPSRLLQQCLLVYLLAKCHVYSQFYVRPLDLCSACLVMLQCQQPCMTRSTGLVSDSVTRSSYVCRHTSVCTVWHLTTCHASARY